MKKVCSCIQDVCVRDTPRSLRGTLLIHLLNMTVGIKVTKPFGQSGYKRLRLPVL